MYESFFEMTKTPFTRGIPVDMLYSNNDNEEIYNRLVYAAKKQLFAILIGKRSIFIRIIINSTL